jgi:hypothetical protein
MPKLRVRSRKASLEELEEDRRRCLAAKAPEPEPKPEPTEGNLCGALVLLARWRKCSVFDARVLFVNEQARTDGEFICGGCEAFLARMQRGIQFLAAAASLAVLVLS